GSPSSSKKRHWLTLKPRRDRGKSRMKQSATLVASVSLLIGILLMVHPSPAARASPREQLDDFFRQATTLLSEASDASQARHEIRQLARLRFDVPGAARRVLEPEWSALSVVERDEFIQSSSVCMPSRRLAAYGRQPPD